MHASLVKSARNAIPLHAVASKDAKHWTRRVPFLKASGFSGKEGEMRLIPGRGGVASAVLGLGKSADALALAAFAEQLPDGVYRLGEVPDFCGGACAALAWILGLYSFDRYKKPRKRNLKLVLPAGVDGAEVSRIAAGVALARDLVNTPPNDMGPAELAVAARALAKAQNAKFRTIGGDALTRDYPLIAAVGQGSERAPQLIELIWGDAKAPKVTLVGKGVCFDTGGYNLKPTSGMATMKKDMGGGAVVLGLAQMLMEAKLAIRLRVLVPAVENSVSGRAYRPSDVFKSRKGLTVEIGNTDAEGRLVLADALADADDETPELLIDIATLTGAARMATGMELPPFFTDDEVLAADLSRHAMAVGDPMWRLPLWRGYEGAISGSVADLTNSPSYNLAGAITAALFLNRFVEKTKSWVHLDIPAWVDRPKPGRRIGGEANGARALYALLKERYGR
ncbi:MAG TPA: leucyl aminopeptidase family protein [Rhizomicrobium sp.]|jgi:leucyl aminopeptidase|nr:leucyl aminopeptidase family protein [Rhizomicrobium sp.]